MFLFVELESDFKCCLQSHTVEWSS